MRRALPLLLLLALALATPGALAAAEQVHLGLPTSDAATARSILWLDTAAPGERSVTVRGPDGEREVAAARVDGPSAGFAYEAQLDGLVPGATYEYEVDGRAFSFATPAANRSSTVSFVALGDMGITAQAARAVAAIEQIAPEFVLHAGDVSYAEGDPVAWKAWFDLVEPIAAATPWITAIGNHETYTGSSAMGLLGVPSPAEEAFYLQRFGLPNNELWFSFDWGPVHVISLDTFSSQGLSAAQAAWLAQDLAASADAPWRIAILHEPPYSSNSHGDSPRVQDALVPALEAAGVDLVIAAHDHGYERSWPLRAGAPVATAGAEFAAGVGTIYLVTGGGGQSLYTGWTQPAPAWSASREALYHVVHLTATPERLEARVVATDDSAFGDTFAIVRGDVAPVAEGEPEPVAAIPALAPLAVALVVALAALVRRRG